jgi:hypothetical protein
MKHEIAEEAFGLAATGGAICFLGAGFSRGACDQQGKDVPSTADLELEIKQMIGFDTSEAASLSDLADYCEDSTDLRKKLQILLASRLTLTKPKEYHCDLLRLPWRAIFTTNFDDLVESCLSADAISIITPTTNTITSPVSKIPVYYLHGRAKDILDSDKDPSLVISESNYLRLKEENRNLYARLTNEIICARAIILIGYSLKDLQIAQIFFSASEDIRNKTYIICAPGENPVSLARLKKFGAVIPIGTESAASIANSIPKEKSFTTKDFSFVEEYSPPPISDSEIEISDIERLIISGSFDPTKYEQQLSDTSGASLYCVERNSVIIPILDNKTGIRRFVARSNLGNGKSLFLEQLAYRAFRRGISVFRIETNLNDVYEELETICSSGREIIFLVDDVVRYRAVAKFIGARLNNLSTLVCTTRGESEHSIFDVQMTDLGGAVTELDLDVLHDEELVAWDALLERWGLWEDQIADPIALRLKFLQKNCGGENRSIVLSIFNKSIISDKIDSIVSYFLRQHREHSRAFVAMLIVSLCQHHVRWANVVQWCQIDEANLKKDIKSSDIFDFLRRSHGSWHLIASSQLAAYILNTRGGQITQQTIVDVYTRIVRETAYSANDARSGSDYRENLKELMRYRFLTKLFGESDNAMGLIASVYKTLSSVPRIRVSDQFWLQYAMSRMEAGDLANAERYLNDALGIARGKGAGYSPHQIIDQLVRLLFEKNSVNSDDFNHKEIDVAIRYMRERIAKIETEIIYQYRSVPHILNFVERHADNIENALRLELIDVVEQILSSAATKSTHGAKKGELVMLKKAAQDVLRVLRFM